VIKIIYKRQSKSEKNELNPPLPFLHHAPEKKLAKLENFLKYNVTKILEIFSHLHVYKQRSSILRRKE